MSKKGVCVDKPTGRRPQQLNTDPLRQPCIDGCDYMFDDAMACSGTHDFPPSSTICSCVPTSTGGYWQMIEVDTDDDGTFHKLQVFNEDGSTEIFGYNVRGGHHIATGTITLANGATSTVAAEGMTATNTSNVVVGFNDQYKGTITRGTNQVTFGNSYGSTITFTYHILRL